MKLTPCRSSDPVNDRALRDVRGTNAVRWALLVAVVMLAVPLLILYDVSDDVAAMTRLVNAPPADTSAAAVPYWGSASAVAAGAGAGGANAVCDVQSQYYKSGKNGGWRQEARASWVRGSPRVLLADGREVVMGETATQFVPLRASEAPPARAEGYRRANAELKAQRIVEQCLTAGPVFVDGCLTAGEHGAPATLHACAGRGALTLTPGTRRDRLAEHARGPGAALGFVAFGLTVAVLVVASRLRGASAEASLGLAALPSQLGGRLPAAERRPGWRLRLALGAVPLTIPPALLVLVLTTPVPAQVFFAGLGVLVPYVGALYLLAERRTVRALERALTERPTASLDAAEGAVVELAVRVASEAPLIEAPLTGRRVAHVWLKIWRRVVTGSGRKIKSRFEVVHTSSPSGASLPIADATGAGSLDLTGALHDVAAVQTRCSAAELPEAVRRLADVTAGDFVVREAVLVPGDPLYVLGPVQRTADPETQRFTYRSGSTAARVASGESQLPLFVHGGTEQTLLGALRRARRREGLAFVVLATVWVASSLALAALTRVSLVG